MCPQTRSRSSANFRSRLSRPSPVAQQPRARPSQRGPSAGARGPPSMRWWLLSVRALRWGYFEKEKNVLVVADRREQPVQTSYRALLLLTQRPPRDIPVFGQGKNVDLSVDYSPPYSAFTHDGARHRGPIRARRSWAIQRGSKIRSQKHFPEVKLKTARSREIRRTLRRFTTNNKISSSWSGHRSLTTARRDLVSSRRAVLLKIDLFVLLSEGERCGATSAGGGWRRSREASSCGCSCPAPLLTPSSPPPARHTRATCTHGPGASQGQLLGHFPAPFSRVTAGTSVQLIKSGKVSRRGTKQCFGSGKRPSSVGQGTSRVKRCQTAQSMSSSKKYTEFSDLVGPKQKYTWASAKGKKSVRYNISFRQVLSSSYYQVPRPPPQSATVCEEVPGIDLEVESAARAIEHRALLVEMRPFAGLTLKSREPLVLSSTALSSRESSSYYGVPRSPRRNATFCEVSGLDLESRGSSPYFMRALLKIMIRGRAAESAHSHIASKSVNCTHTVWGGHGFVALEDKQQL
ncbi:hypothetical protein DFH06DRAFT_1132113 [Mycena polygramma]|nr:hypothetical protein DFH06DRAFT_1132113 [Mycena polygramma]